MSKTFVFIFMLFCHVFDDYFLQGCLANMKQKRWWTGNPDPVARQPKYRNDYKMALLMHSVSWSFMIMLPVAIYHNFDVSWAFLGMYILNVLMHAVIDDAKANEGTINLVGDQILHIFYIVETFMCLVVLV